MRFKAHESFFIRKGWLYKGLKNIRETPNLFSDKGANATDILGIGTNMVRSLRYWLQATGLSAENTSGARFQTPTPLADVIWQYDKYMEEIGTLWLLHYKLSTNKWDATAWYYFFNEFNMKEFAKDDYVGMLESYVQINGETAATTSIDSDFDCVMQTYVSRIKSNPEKVHPESNIDCPLGELNLVDIVDKKKKIYRKAAPKNGTLNPMILLAVIIDNVVDNKEIKINAILTDKGNAGKVFNLDIIGLTEMLYELQKTGLIKVNRTAGLDVIRIDTDLTFEQVVERYYQSLIQ